MTIDKKSEAVPVSVRVPCEEDQWPLLKRTVHEYGMCVGVDDRTLKKLEVATEEAVVNILHYSQATEIELTINKSGSELSIGLTDDGTPFDPTTYRSDTSQRIDERQIGGLGISLIRKIADELRYQRTDSKNQLIIIKHI